jgi:hypothetical protein
LPKNQRKAAGTAIRPGVATNPKKISPLTPAPKQKQTPRANPLQPKKKSQHSHDDLNARFRAIGRQLVDRLTGKPDTLPDVKSAFKATGHKANVFTRAQQSLPTWERKHKEWEKWQKNKATGKNLQSLKKSPSKKGPPSKYKLFDNFYRASWKGQDEFVPTSAMREIIFGIFEKIGKNPLSRAKTGEINGIIDKVSLVRLQTQMVGYALVNNEIMQHPEKGFAANPQTSDAASAHSYHDIERKAEICVAMETALKNRSATFQDVMVKGVAAAVGYTLNEMAAPFSARNVKPFSAKAKEPILNLLPNLQFREQLKAIGEMFQLTQEVAAGPIKTDVDRAREYTREWDRHGKRSTSPTRTLGDDENTWQKTLTQAKQQITVQMKTQPPPFSRARQQVPSQAKQQAFVAAKQQAVQSALKELLSAIM